MSDSNNITNEFSFEETKDNGIVISGTVSVNEAFSIARKSLKGKSYNRVDLSQGHFMDEEREEVRQICLGYSHSGGVYYNRTVKVKYNSLQILLEIIDAREVVLPPDVKRKQLNVCINNDAIGLIIVPENCRLFSMKGDDIWNKKGTILIHGQSKG